MDASRWTGNVPVRGPGCNTTLLFDASLGGLFLLLLKGSLQFGHPSLQGLVPGKEMGVVAFQFCAFCLEREKD